MDTIHFYSIPLLCCEVWAPFSCRAVEGCEMLLAYYIGTSPIQSLDFIPVGSLQRAKHPNVIGLELMGGVRRNTAQEDVVFKAEL
jgi:hypothetical protein